MIHGKASTYQYHACRCEECRKAASKYGSKYKREYYLANKDRQIASQKISIAARRVVYKKWVADIKAKTGCSRCSENDPICLDFHHKDPKDKVTSISKLVCLPSSKHKISREIDKCIVLCSNCHRKLHAEDSFSANKSLKGN